MILKIYKFANTEKYNIRELFSATNCKLLEARFINTAPAKNIFMLHRILLQDTVDGT